MSDKSNLSNLLAHSKRAWVYRENHGWLFAELTPEELAEFRSYRYDITIPYMRIRPPAGQQIRFLWGLVGNFANWFGFCTMTPIPPVVQARFPLQQVPDDEHSRLLRMEPGRYGTWLWADEADMCRELGCEVAVHDGLGWYRWDAPTEPPAQFKERIFIYAIVNEITKVIYIGQTDNLDRRWNEHRRDTKHAAKVTLLQSIRALDRKPGLQLLEEVPEEKAHERERYWTTEYKRRGYTIINKDYKSLIE